MKLRIALLILPLLLLSACREEKTEILSDLYTIEADTPPKVISKEADVEAIFKTIKLKSPHTDKFFGIQVFVDEQGNVDKINITDIIEKGTDISDRMAEAFSKLKFEPAVLNGKKVKAQTLISLKAEGMTGSDTKWSIKTKDDSGISTEGMISSDLPDSLRGDLYFVAAEQMPAPVGGIEFIQSKIKYPEIAKRAGIEGKVFVRAYIDENGTVVHTSMIKGIGQNVGIDEAAMEAIRQTKFKPAMHKGRAIKTQVSIPILFKLQ